MDTQHWICNQGKHSLRASLGGAGHSGGCLLCLQTASAGSAKAVQASCGSEGVCVFVCVCFSLYVCPYGTVSVSLSVGVCVSLAVSLPVSVCEPVHEPSTGVPR